MRFLLLFLLLLTGCREAGSSQAVAADPGAGGFCRQILYAGSRFTACRDPQARMELHSAGADGRPYRSFAALEHALGGGARRVAFAMNAGMFDGEGGAIGLLVERGRELHPINRKKGGGNFHLLPNGVFLVRNDGGAEVVEASRYRGSTGVVFATQSGPMLVIDGRLHPAFEPDGQSRFIRNGVGIAPDGSPVFVISEEPVSFGKLARFFRDRLKCRAALYFDGSVSSLWDPAAKRMDSFAALGPMVVAMRPAETR